MKRITFFSLLFTFALAANAQKIKLESGNLNFLSGVTSLDVSFVYPENLKVGNISEKEYVDRKISEYNAKEAGRGDTWHQAWLGDRATRYEPKFEELFAKNIQPAELAGGDNTKYMLIVTTTRIEPGYNVGVMRKPAGVDLKISFVEKANTGKVLAVVSVINAPGNSMGNDFDTGERIKEAYAKAGKEFGRFLLKKF